MNTHGLLATTISMLISSAHSDVSTILRREYRDKSSLQRYQKYMGQKRKNRMRAVFGLNSTVKGTRREEFRQAEMEYERQMI